MTQTELALLVGVLGLLSKAVWDLVKRNETKNGWRTGFAVLEGRILVLQSQIEDLKTEVMKLREYWIELTRKGKE